MRYDVLDSGQSVLNAEAKKKIDVEGRNRHEEEKLPEKK